MYNSIYKLLTSSETVLNYIKTAELINDVNFAPDLAGEENAEVRKLLAYAIKIQKQQIPKELSARLPLITFYKLPGGKDSGNNCVYNATFMFDIYTAGDVELAHKLSEELYSMFNDKFIDIIGYDSFKCEWLDAYESTTNDPDTYCFTNLVSLSIETKN